MKKRWTMPLCMMLAAGIAGCSAGNVAENGQKNTDAVRSEKNMTAKDNLARNISDRAPLFGSSGNKGNGLGNLGNPAVPLGYNSGNLDQENDFSTRDRNYHNHEGVPQRTRSSYYTAYEGALVDSIVKKANSVQGVKDSRAIITRDRILVTLLVRNNQSPSDVKKDVRNKINKLSGKRELTVVSDQGLYYRVISLDNDLRDGGPRDMVLLDAQDLFDNLDLHKNHAQ
ncbi:YhcN/YlaJ family sporulation lipoprotein [Actinomycetes bacterium NPDC127524]